MKHTIRSPTCILLLFSLVFSYAVDFTENRRPSLDDFMMERNDFLVAEESRQLGARLKLNQKELQANEIIMLAKNKEYNEGLASPHLFAPSRHIFSVLEKISFSPLFQYISRMPKGAVLHAHDTALSSTDFLIKLTYRPKLWACLADDLLHVFAFRYSKRRPTMSINGADCKWRLMKRLRRIYGESVIDNYLRKRFTLFPKEEYVDNNEVWRDFMGIFILLDGLLCFAPNWADYYYNALEEFYADGVQYLEFRSTLPKLYDLENGTYNEFDTAEIYKNTIDKFKAENPDFIGSRLIYAPLRSADDAGMAHYVNVTIELKKRYPTFFAGFDLVGQEEMGRPLKELAPFLLTMPEDINFYFHAGETNWYGSSIDENLIDAVLLGTKRIGHGFALVKHPLVLDRMKQQNIAVEVNPISNQVLQLVKDYRNHPCAHYFSDNYPVVISSDDPSFWKTKPLSHDFYIAFLGMASKNSDLRLLKQLAMNSLIYSSLNNEEARKALHMWQIKWDNFIEDIVRGNETLTDNKVD